MNAQMWRRFCEPVALDVGRSKQRRHHGAHRGRLFCEPLAFAHQVHIEGYVNVQTRALRVITHRTHVCFARGDTHHPLDEHQAKNFVERVVGHRRGGDTHRDAVGQIAVDVKMPRRTGFGLQ